MLLRLFFGLVAVVSDSSASQARSINSESQGCSMDTGVGSGDAAEAPEVEEVPMVPEARDDNAPNDPEPEAPELPVPAGSPWISTAKGLQLFIVTISMGAVSVPRRLLQQGFLFFVRRSPWIHRLVACYESGDSLQHKHTHYVGEGFVDLTMDNKTGRVSVRVPECA